MTTPSANIGVVGLAVMGSNLARNLARRKGNVVAVFNRSAERTRARRRAAISAMNTMATAATAMAIRSVVLLSMLLDSG